MLGNIADVLGSADASLAHQVGVEHVAEGDLTQVEPTYCWAGVQVFACELVAMNWKCFPPSGKVLKVGEVSGKSLRIYVSRTQLKH